MKLISNAIATQSDEAIQNKQHKYDLFCKVIMVCTFLPPIFDLLGTFVPKLNFLSPIGKSTIPICFVWLILLTYLCIESGKFYFLINACHGFYSCNILGMILQVIIYKNYFILFLIPLVLVFWVLVVKYISKLMRIIRDRRSEVELHAQTISIVKQTGTMVFSFMYLFSNLGIFNCVIDKITEKESDLNCEINLLIWQAMVTQTGCMFFWELMLTNFGSTYDGLITFQWKKWEIFFFLHKIFGKIAK